ncbi:hypothetical protein [Streptosporangium sp. NPDC002721]|uniref:hypothetical protein n=1 Tax=Streptosporangium sp. NPDC002721 TaxID=3366188 RepID=UPI0036835E6D
MARFKRLTVEEARTLSREELLPLIEDEQKHWCHSGYSRRGPLSGRRKTGPIPGRADPVSGRDNQ